MRSLPFLAILAGDQEAACAQRHCGTVPLQVQRPGQFRLLLSIDTAVNIQLTVLCQFLFFLSPPSPCSCLRLLWPAGMLINSSILPQSRA